MVHCCRISLHSYFASAVRAVRGGSRSSAAEGESRPQEVLQEVRLECPQQDPATTDQGEEAHLKMFIDPEFRVLIWKNHVHETTYISCMKCLLSVVGLNSKEASECYKSHGLT